MDKTNVPLLPGHLLVTHVDLEPRFPRLLMGERNAYLACRVSASCNASFFAHLAVLTRSILDALPKRRNLVRHKLLSFWVGYARLSSNQHSQLRQ